MTKSRAFFQRRRSVRVFLHFGGIVTVITLFCRTRCLKPRHESFSSQHLALNLSCPPVSHGWLRTLYGFLEMKKMGFPFFFYCRFFFDSKSVCLVQTVQHFSNNKRGFVFSQLHPRKNKPLEIKTAIHHHGFRSPFFSLCVFPGDFLSSSCVCFHLSGCGLSFTSFLSSAAVCRGVFHHLFCFFT